MMDNFYGVFNSKDATNAATEIINTSLQNSVPSVSPVGSSLSPEEIKEMVLAANKNEDVTVTISDQPLSTIVTSDIPKVKYAIQNATYFPQTGVIVQKTDPELAEHPEIDKRISMVETATNLDVAEADQLTSLAQLAQEEEIHFNSILDEAGAFQEGIIEIDFHAKVEVGDYRTNGITLFDSEGNILTQPRTTEAKVNGRVENRSTMEIILETDSGNEITLNVFVNDGVNKFRANGMAREIEINLSASEALTKDEAEAVNAYTKQVDALLNTFHLDKSLLQEDFDTLQHFVGESNEFISTDITFTHEYHNPAILDESLGNSFREIQISSGRSGALQVSVNEENMSYKYYENVVEALVPPPPYDQGFNVPGSDYLDNHEYNSAGGDPDFYNEAVTDSINREISPINHYAQTYLG